MADDSHQTTPISEQKIREIAQTDPQRSLHLAAANGMLDLLKELLKFHIVNDSNLLMAAAQNNQLGVAIWLINNTNAKLSVGLYGAGISGSVGLIELFLELGATETENIVHGAATEGRMDLVRKYLTKNVGLDQAVLYAVRSGCRATVELFLDCGADPLMATRKALAEGNEEMASFLMSFQSVRNAMLENPDKEHSVANNMLLHACCGGNISLVMRVIQYGANNWLSAVFGSARKGHEDILEFVVGLIDNKMRAYTHAMYGAAYGGQLVIVKRMVKRGVRCFNGAMLFAAEGGHNDVIRYLVGKGADNFKECLKAAQKSKDFALELYFAKLLADRRGVL